MAAKTNRRAVLAGAAVAASASVGEASAEWWPFGRRQGAQATPAQHEGHAAPGGEGRHDAHRGHMNHHSGGPGAGAGLNEAETRVVHALLHCSAAGETCLTHCLALLAQGDASMAGCARGVREMLAVCAATRTLLQGRSTLAAAQLAVCRDACAACRAACQPHAGHHAECAACAESCAQAITAIDALLA